MKNLLVFVAFCLTVFTAAAQKCDITISNTTSGGTWSGGTSGPYVFTPNSSATTATINVADITDRLLTGGTYTQNNVTINTSNSTGGGNGDITVSTTITAANALATTATLTFNADRNITVSSAINFTASSTGGSGGTSRPGLNLVLTATGSVTISAALTTTGNCRGNAPGGVGGTITITAGTNVYVNGVLTTIGDTPTSNSQPGGAGGDVSITGATGVRIVQNITTTGGNALGGNANGGDAGNITISDGATTVTTGGGVNDGQTAGVIAAVGGTLAGTGLNGAGGTLTKTGSGTLSLAGSNTYTGSTIIDQGTLRLGAAGGATNTPLGTTAAGTSITTGACLDLNGFTLGTTEALTLNGDGISSAGALINSSSTASTYSGLITLGSNSTIEANSGNIIISNTGTITGATFNLILDGTATGCSLASIIGTTSGTLTKQGSGTWTLTGANTFTGSTTISGGTLSINADARLGTAPGSPTAGQLTIDGGTLAITTGFTLNTNRSLAIGSGGATIDVASGQTLTYGGTIAGANNLTKANSGALTLTNQSVSVNNLTISAGTLTATSGTMTVAGNFSNAGTFSNNSGTVSLTGATSSITNSGTLTFNNLTISGSATGATTASSFNIAGTLNVNNSGGFNASAGTITFNNASSTITNSGTLSFNGLTISTTPTAQSQYNASYSVKGTLTISATTFTPTGGTITMSGTSWAITNSATTLTFSGLTIAGTPSSQPSASFNVAGALTVNSGITLAPTGGTITMNNGGSIVNNGGATTNLVFQGLAIASSATVTTSSSFNIAGTLTVNSGATFSPSGGTITMSNAASTITNSSGTLTFSGLTIGATPTAQTQYNTSYGVAGALTVNSGVTFAPTGGTITMNNGGSIVNNGGATTNLVFQGLAIASSATVTTSSSFNIAGTLTVNSGATFSPSGGTITMSNTASTITNSSGTLTFRGLTIGATPTSQAQYNTSFNVAGALTVNSGITFAPTGGTITMNNGGSIVNNGGATTNLVFQGLAVASSATVTTSSSFNIAGTLTVNSGATFSPSGGTITMSNAASSISNSSGTLTFAGLTISTTPTAQTQYNTSFNIAGALTVNSGITFAPSGGTITMNNGGSIVNNGGATTNLVFSGLTIAASATVTTSSSFNVSGILTANNASTFAPSAGTITMSSASSGISVSGTPTSFVFKGLTISTTPTAQSQYNASYSVSATLTVGSITFAPTGGTITMSAAASTISNSGTLTFSGLTIAATPTAQTQYNTSFAVGGALTVNSGVTFAPTSGTITMNNGASIANNGGAATNLVFNNLSIAASSTVSATNSFNVNATFTTLSTSVLNMGTASLGVVTVSHAGTINTQALSSAITSGKTWGGTVNYSATGGGQSVIAGTYNNLTLSNTSGTNTASGNLSSSGTFTTTAGGTLNMGTNTLTVSTVSNSGTINTQATSSAITSGKTWGGTVNYNATNGSQTIIAGTYNNLSSGGSTGTNSASAITVNGTLTIASSTTVDMSTNLLSGTITGSGSGTLRSSSTNNPPIPSGINWGNITVILEGSSSIVPAGTFKDISLTTTNKTATGALAISGVLTVSSGLTLDMSTNALSGAFTTSGTGTVKTASTTNPPIPSGRTWTMDVWYYSTTGDQYIPASTFSNLKIDGNIGFPKYTTGSVSVAGTLTLASGVMALYNEGVYNAGTSTAATLTFSGSTASISSSGGYIEASAYNNLSTSLASTVVFANTNSLTIPNGVFLSGTDNITVNGGATITIGGTSVDNFYIFKALSTSASGSYFAINGTILNLLGTVSMSLGNGLKAGPTSTLKVGSGTASINLGTLYFDSTSKSPNKQIFNFVINTTGGGSMALGDTMHVVNTFSPPSSNGLSQFTFTSGGNLVIGSRSTYNGRIDKVFTNFSFAGNVKVERYSKSKVHRRYLFIGSPVDNISLRNAWQDDVYITSTNSGGVPCGTGSSKYDDSGYDATIAKLTSFYKYVQPSSSYATGQWIAVNSPTTSFMLQKGVGYRLFYRGPRGNGDSANCVDYLTTSNPSAPDSAILNVSGTPTSGDVTVTVAAGNGATLGGYTLVSNPYASELNWTTFQSDNNAVISGSYYIHDPNGTSSTGYLCFNNGTIVGSDGNTQNAGGNNSSGTITSSNATRIASGQAFFIRTIPAKTTGGTVTFKEAHKTSQVQLGALRGTGTSALDPKNQIRIGFTQTDSTYIDDVVVRFGDDPSITKSPNEFWDANSLNTSSPQFLASIKNTSSYAIQTRPLDFYNDTVLLRVSSTTVGSFRLVFKDFENFTAADQIVLLDLYTGSVSNVKTNQYYDFSISGTGSHASQGGRFKLVFRSATSVLPISFINISATQRQQGAEIDWKVAFEQNISHYEVERSEDGRDFKAIAKVASKGNSSNAVDYSYIDATPIKGTVYYRIKSVEAGGDSKYTSIVKLNSSKESLVTLYPNPVKDKLKLVISNSQNFDKANFTVTNTLGRAILQQKLQGSNGNYTIDVSNLSAGMYILTIVNQSGDRINEKFIKE